MPPRPATTVSVAYNLNGTAMFPTAVNDNATVPQYLNVVRASVSEFRSVFYFPVQMNATIPSHPKPAFAVDHMGPTFGIFTNRSTSLGARFIGHTETNRWNYFVGMLYRASADGAHIGWGWQAFVTSPTTNFTRLPSSIGGSTVYFQVNASYLGNPSGFRWLVGVEVDPVPIAQETYRTTLIVDYTPNSGYARWP
jgi:hypothetical protein